jgi:hypothetical protein
MGRHRWKVTEADIDLMQQLYEGNEKKPGLSLQRISEAFTAFDKKISPQLIGYHLRRRGVTMRPAPPNIARKGAEDEPEPTG